MSDLTFAQQLHEYERWKRDAGNTSPEKYEEWQELTRKADLWDALTVIWEDVEEDADSVLDFLGETMPA